MRLPTGRRPAIAAARHPALLAALSYVVLALVILGPSIRPGRTVVPADLLGPLPPYQHLTVDRAQNPIVSDAADQFYPWMAFIRGSLRKGEIPEWNPTILGGVRANPNGYVNPYYPPTWLARWLDAFDTYNAFVFLHLVIAALGVYVLSRVLGARPLASWVAGVLALTADFWIHWSLHLVHFAAFALMPWMLAAAHVAVTRPTKRSVGALALAVGLALLGGNPQYVYFGLLAAGGYAALRLVRDKLLDHTPIIRRALAVGAGFVLGAALAAVAILPGLAIRPLIERSREGPIAMAGALARTDEGIRFLVPDAHGNPPDKVDVATSPEAQMDSPFVGVTAVLLVAAAAVAKRQRLLLLAGAGTVVLLAFVGPPNRLLYDVLPGYDSFRVAARWLAVLPVFVLPAAALGLDSLLAGERRCRFAVLAGAGVAAILVANWFVHNRHKAGVPSGYFTHRAAWAIGVIALVAAAAFLLTRAPKVAVAVICLCAVGEVLVHTPRWYPSVVEASAYPRVHVVDVARSAEGRVVHVAPGERTPFSSFASDVPMAYGVGDVQGWTVFFPKQADRFLRLIDNYGTFAVFNNLAPPLSNPTEVRSPGLTALDARTVISSVPVNAPEVRPAGDSPYTYVRQTLGPAWLVPRAVASTEKQAWDGIARNWSPDQVAYVQGLPRDVTGGTGTVRGGARGPDGERWTVDGPAGGFLVVSGAYDEGWSARLDGKAVPTYQTDGMLRGVAVPAGHHVVEFSYSNGDEHRGRIISAIAALVILALLVAPDRHGRRRSEAGASETSGSPAAGR